MAAVDGVTTVPILPSDVFPEDNSDAEIEILSWELEEILSDKPVKHKVTREVAVMAVASMEEEEDGGEFVLQSWV